MTFEDWTAGGFDDAPNRRDCGCDLPEDGLDADHWTRREFMLGDKKAGPFKLEVAWVKVIDGKNGK